MQHEDMLTKLDAAFQSGDAPDVYMERGGGELADHVEAGPDQGPLRARPRTPSTRSAAPSPGWQVDGKTYALPFSLGVVGFWYNKALFEKAGITDAAHHDGRALRRRRQAQGRRHRADLRRCGRQVAGRPLLVLPRAARVLAAGAPGRREEPRLLRPVLRQGRRGPARSSSRPSRSTRASCPPRPRPARRAPPACSPPARSRWRCRATGSPASCRASPRTRRAWARTPAGSPFPAVDRRRRATRAPRSAAATPGPWPRTPRTPRSSSSKYLLSDEVQKGFAERDMGLPTNPAATRLGQGPGARWPAQGPRRGPVRPAVLRHRLRAVRRRRDERRDRPDVRRQGDAAGHRRRRPSRRRTRRSDLRDRAPRIAAR